MSEISLDDYLREYLSPAEEEFRRTLVPPDCFTRYGLPIAADNDAEIQTAIRTVRGFWNGLKHQNPKFKPLVSRLLDPREDEPAQQVLLNPASRRRERSVIEQRRRDRKEELLRELDKELESYTVDGKIDAHVYQRVSAAFTSRGLSQKEIDARNRAHLVTKRKHKSHVPKEGIDRGQRAVIEQNLRLLNKRDLYDFLGVARGGARAVMEEAIRLKCAELDHAKNNDAKAAAQALIGVLNQHCKGGDMAAYEHALRFECVRKLKESVELYGEGATITAAEFSALAARGIQLGIPEGEVEELVLDFARGLNMFVEPGPRRPSSVCPHCGSSVDSAAERCANPACGGLLRETCRGCGEPRASGNQVCDECGLRSSDFPMIEQALTAAQAAAAQHEWIAVALRLKQIKTRWKGADRYPDVYKLTQELAAIQETNRHRAEKIQANIVERKLYSAQKLLNSFGGSAADDLKIGGRNWKTVAAEVDTAIAEVKRLLAQAKQTERESGRIPASALFQQALSIAADCSPAAEGIKRCTLQGPATAAARANGGHVIVEWPPAPEHGRIRYVVCRSSRSAPLSPRDGDIVGTTAETSVIDAQAAKAGACIYSVFAESGETYSEPVSTDAIMLTPELEKVVLRPGNGVVTGTWTMASPFGRPRVVRRLKGLFNVLNPNVEIPAGKNGFEDRSVANGNAYEYKMTVVYEAFGEDVETVGTAITAKPTAPSFGCGCLVLAVIVIFWMLLAALSRAAELPAGVSPQLASPIMASSEAK